MNPHKINLCSCLFLFFFTGAANAQLYLGVATGEYNAMNSIYLNPANIAGCKEKIEISIFSFGVAVDNSLGTFAKLSDIGSGNVNTFNNSGTNTFSMLLPAAEIRGPGVMIGLNDAHQQSFALTTRIRVMNQFNNFSQSLYSLVTNPNQTTQNYNYQTSNFNWTAHLWSEIGLSYGLVILDNGQSQLKAGITLRYLGGIDYLSLKGNNLDVNYNNGSDTFYASHSDLEFASNIISANNAITNGVTASSLLSSFFGSKAGSGLGSDIGVTYTYRFDDDDPATAGKDDNDIDGHKLKLSAAVTDLGAITYKESDNSIVDVTGNGYVTGTGLSENSGNYANFRNYVVGQGFTADTASKSVKVHMPTALLLSADYEVYQHVFANLTYLGNLVNRQLYGNSYYSQVTVTPRYDMKLFSIGMPITYSALAHDVKLGLGFRIGGFFVGSDDMLALVSSNQHGFGFYFGGYIPLYKKKPQNEISQ
jgi:hypothetical protein